MGGQGNLSLSSHRRDDEQYNAKRDELRQYIPQLEQHLSTLRSRGFHWQQCGLFSVLANLHKQLTEPVRVPYHVLLGGEDLLKREVLQLEQEKAAETTVECVWRSSHFRAAIRQKLDEALQEVSDQKYNSLDSSTVEAKLFAEAKTKDEYLELSARVIIHLQHLKNEVQPGEPITKSNQDVKMKRVLEQQELGPTLSVKRKKLNDEAAVDEKCK